MAYSTWVSLMRWPFFSRRAVAGVQHEGRLADLAVVADVAADAAVEGVHAGGQLGGGEGLGDIVVGAGHKAGDLVHLLGAGGEHDDADVRVGRADAAADLEAVDVRQHDVQQGHTDIGVLAQLLQRLLAGSRPRWSHTRRGCRLMTTKLRMFASSSRTKIFFIMSSQKPTRYTIVHGTTWKKVY